MNRSHPRTRSTPRPRSGLVLVAAMIALLVATMIGGNVARIVVREHRAVGEAELRLQAEWLVEAGLQRGTGRLARDAEYRGEEWRIPPDDLGGPGVARVEIRIEPIENDPEGTAFTVTVRAEYPIDTPRRATASRTIRVPRPPEETDR
jgi:hypothetical protein